MIRPLRVILPLYNTEIHYIVRADSPMNYLHDIKDAKINGGLVGSGAAYITHTLYRMMFDKPIPEANASFLSNEEALTKLITDKSVDVVVVAAGQPAPLVVNMKPEAQKFIKFLKFDPNHSSSKLPLTTYTYATVKKSSYPNLLTEDFTTIAVGAFLVTYDYNMQGTMDHMVRFARSLCQHFPELREQGHPKWREVDLSLAGPRYRLDLLSADGTRDSRVRRRPEDESAGEAEEKLHRGGTHTRALRIMRRAPVGESNFPLAFVPYGADTRSVRWSHSRSAAKPSCRSAETGVTIAVSPSYLTKEACAWCVASLLPSRLP